MKILIINGPNLNLLGKRETSIYGDKSMDALLSELKAQYTEDEIIYFQSNHEGEIIDYLQSDNSEAIIINPGAFTHYSYAIADCLKNIQKPKIEVHISNIHQREEFRKKSVTASHCDAILSGFGILGYELALQYLKNKSLSL